MCHIAIAIGLGALQAQQQARQAKAMAVAQGKMFEANAKNSMEAFVNETQQLNLRERQEKEKAMAAKMQSDLQAMQLESRGKVASANSGVFLNNNAAMQNLARQGLVSGTSIQSNLGQVEDQLQMARYGAATTYQSRINSVAAPTFNKSNVMLGAGLSGAQTGMAYYSAFGGGGAPASSTAVT